jgi:hypothetical protein
VQINQLRNINQGAIPVYYYDIDKLEGMLNDMNILHDNDVLILQHVRRDARWEKALCVCVQGVEGALK